MSTKRNENFGTNMAADSARIGILREKLHLSKTQFAIGIGYTATQITRAKIGGSTVSDELCERISSTYGVKKEWLFGGEGKPWIKGSNWSVKSGPQKETAGERLREKSIWKADLVSGSSASVLAAELQG